MIRSDWAVARLVLQIMAEQGPGLLYAQAEAAETAALQASLAALRGSGG